MNHLAVDLGSRQSQVCLRSVEGTVLREERVPNRGLQNFFKEIPKSRVVLETCAEAFAVARLATVSGHEVNVVPATLAPSLGVGQRGVKTDRKDAQNLSMASCRMEHLPKVHVPSPLAQELRAQLTTRALLVSHRTATINCVRGWARTELLELAKTTRENFTTKVRDLALMRPEGLPRHIERLLKLIDALNEQLDEANEELKAMTERDPICVRLMSMPGVGPVTSASFRAAIDSVERFKSARAVESYFGLTPGERSSGLKAFRVGITGAGAARVRGTLVQAAWCAYRSRPLDPMVVWAKNIAARSPVQKAIVALARKMAGILFAMWRDNAEYSASHQK